MRDIWWALYLCIKTLSIRDLSAIACPQQVYKFGGIETKISGCSKIVHTLSTGDWKNSVKSIIETTTWTMITWILKHYKPTLVYSLTTHDTPVLPIFDSDHYIKVAPHWFTRLTCGCWRVGGLWPATIPWQWVSVALFHHLLLIYSTI